MYICSMPLQGAPEVPAHGRPLRARRHVSEGVLRRVQGGRRGALRGVVRGVELGAVRVVAAQGVRLFKLCI